MTYGRIFETHRTGGSAVRKPSGGAVPMRTSVTPFDERTAPRKRPQKTQHRMGSFKGISHTVELRRDVEPFDVAGAYEFLDMPVFAGRWLFGRELEAVNFSRWAAIHAPVVPANDLEHPFVYHSLQPDLISHLDAEINRLVLDCLPAGEPACHESIYDKAERDLSRLKDGWAGPGTLAPRSSVLSNLGVLVSALPLRADIPEFEVDSGDGTLTLVWNSGSRSFSLIVLGNGKVVGVMSPAEGYAAWTLPIAKEAQITEKLEDERLSSFLGI